METRSEGARGAWILAICVALAWSPSRPGATAVGASPPAPKPTAQEREVDPALPEGGLEWPSPWISEIPTVDLSGEWRFLPERSDPMVEAWRGRDIVYRIDQQPGHVVLEFEPEGGETSTQVYRWDGTVRRDRRGRAEIAERARWRDGGRILEVQGRYWVPGIEHEPHRYRFRYEVRGGLLTFTQTDANGTTTWRFVEPVGRANRRRASPPITQTHS